MNWAITMKPMDAPGKPAAADRDSHWEIKLPGRSAQAASLATRILSLRPNQQDTKAIGLTGLGEKTGHSKLAIQCAVALSEQLNGKVLLLQASSPNKTLSKLLVAPQKPGPKSGWKELALGQVEASDSIAPTNIPNLFLLPSIVSKNENRSPSGSPVSSQLQSTMALLKEQFQIILVDLPCIDSWKGNAGTAAHLDGVVLVADHRRDHRDKLQRATLQYRNQNVHWVGIVLANFRSYVPRFLRRHR